MNILDIVPKHIAISFELSEEEIHKLTAFFNTALNLYQKMRTDEDIFGSDSVPFKFNTMLMSIENELKKREI